MKLMRSRFRLLALLIACAFVLVAVLCIGTRLKESGISLSSLSSSLTSVLPVRESGTVSPSGHPEENPTPAPSDGAPEKNDTPEDPLTPDPAYNVFGL